MEFSFNSFPRTTMEVQLLLLYARLITTLIITIVFFFFWLFVKVCVSMEWSALVCAAYMSVWRCGPGKDGVSRRRSVLFTMIYSSCRLKHVFPWYASHNCPRRHEWNVLPPNLRHVPPFKSVFTHTNTRLHSTHIHTYTNIHKLLSTRKV